jgi:hypothetical protein
MRTVGWVVAFIELFKQHLHLLVRKMLVCPYCPMAGHEYQALFNGFVKAEIKTGFPSCQQQQAHSLEIKEVLSFHWPQIHMVIHRQTQG